MFVMGIFNNICDIIKILLARWHVCIILYLYQCDKSSPVKAGHCGQFWRLITGVDRRNRNDSRYAVLCEAA